MEFSLIRPEAHIPEISGADVGNIDEEALDEEFDPAKHDQLLGVSCLLQPRANRGRNCSTTRTMRLMMRTNRYFMQQLFYYTSNSMFYLISAIILTNSMYGL